MSETRNTAGIFWLFLLILSLIINTTRVCAHGLAWFGHGADFFFLRVWPFRLFSRYRLDGLPNTTGDSYSLWLKEMVNEFGVTADTSLLQSAATDIVSHFKSDITGEVLFVVR